MRYLIDICLLVVLFCHVSGDNSDLMLVQVVWRHGDRAPTMTFPTDANQEDKWPQGWGQLTALGMQQHYALGARLRTMYHDFISLHYNASEIYVRSTDVDRTLMSAMSNLAGFYPGGIVDVNYPSSNDVPNWPSFWSPVPVHTVEESTDRIGDPFAQCDRSDQLWEQIMQSEPFKNLAAQNKDFLAWLTNVTGIPVPITIDIVYIIYDVLLIEKIHNMSLPSWYNDTVFNQMAQITDTVADWAFGIGNPRMPELTKLRGGSLLKEITERMSLKVACMRDPASNSHCHYINQLKYYAYSAHDTTIDALLGTFGDKSSVLGPGTPQYAASIVLELHNTATGPQVRILYHPTFEHPYSPITNLTSGCNTTTEYCPLSTFVARNEPFTPKNITAECQRQPDGSTTTTTTITTTTKPATPSSATALRTWFTFGTQILFSALALLFAAVDRSRY